MPECFLAFGKQNSCRLLSLFSLSVSFLDETASKNKIGRRRGKKGKERGPEEEKGKGEGLDKGRKSSVRSQHSRGNIKRTSVKIPEVLGRAAS